MGFGDTWKKTQFFHLSRMNISFFFLDVRLEIWDGMGGTAENAEIFFLSIWQVSFPFLLLNTIFSRRYGEIPAALDIYICLLYRYFPR